MSNNAAIAAAQRRRAGAHDPPAPGGAKNQKLNNGGEGPAMPKTLGLSDVLDAVAPAEVSERLSGE